MLARLLLGILLGLGLWVSIQPSMSLSPWTPHGVMRKLGMPYPWVLAYEHALPYVLHMLVAAALLVLIHLALPPGRFSGSTGVAWSSLAVVGLVTVAEWVQSVAGRGFDLMDIGCAIGGMLLIAFPLCRR